MPQSSLGRLELGIQPPPASAVATSIIHNLDFIDALLYFANAEGNLYAMEPSSPFYPKAEVERDFRVQGLAQVVDAYCKRRIEEGRATPSQKKLRKAKSGSFKSHQS